MTTWKLNFTASGGTTGSIMEWVVEDDAGKTIAWFSDEKDARQAVADHNVVDVMDRRGLTAQKDIYGEWYAVGERGHCVHPADNYRTKEGRFNPVRSKSPSVALMLADKYLTAQGK